MKITSKGQVTVPQKYRKKLGWTQNTDLDTVLTKDGVLFKSRSGSHGRGHKLVQRLAGKAQTTWTTDQLLALTRG